ncbi:fatty acid--CoA ligase family protein [Stagnimonas aquatica]|uniref:Fatty acid--CoA ligase family protein n=1 Tax=Stagnimonas aquatica TaxID=2689987 RepID=A0A3N0VLH6_9GAMM|nr:FadD3 family acyl-CoA ligase [Stagnimonas aquatica]ROH93561.1 fatty acid--CoA ligase family protein [Stagnimonas aquatica]
MQLTLPLAFAESVRKFADRPALIGEDGRSFSYAQLDAQRRTAAQALIALGVQPKDRVALWAQNTPEWVIAALAVQSIGAVLVPVNTRMRGQEVAYVLERSQAKLLFTCGRFLDQYFPALLEGHRPASLEQLIVLRDAQDGDTTWAQFLNRAEGVDPAEVDRRAAQVRPSDLMDIMFTSGTTGQPKGVMSAHGQNLRVSLEWGKRVELVPEDRYLVINPFFHAFGYKAGWLTALLYGCAILPHAVFDAAAVMKRIERDRISVLPGPPTLFISLLNSPERARTDLSSLRATMTGAATVAPSLIEQMRAELHFKVLLTGYGLTEASGMVSFCHSTDDAETVARTCGKPIPDTEVKCIDEEGNRLPHGVAGELLVRGYNVMQGYLDNPKATAEAIDAEGWLHTGDVAVIDERGYIRITDRLKDMYITGGFNCYPAEIERMMSAHPAIAQVAVIGVPCERQGEVGKAYVTLRPGQSVDEKSLIAWCREQMANYKVPRHIEIVEALPTNASGKVMKFQLPR